MGTMTIEQLLMREDDTTLLNIYNELASCVVPATSYAHDYVRKINRLINEGRLCVVPGRYRNVYLPTVSQMLYKELARRYFTGCYTTKTIKSPKPNKRITATPLERNDELHTCDWCNCDDFDSSDLHSTDIGMLCDNCINAIRSRGEDVYVYD